MTPLSVPTGQIASRAAGPRAPAQVLDALKKEATTGLGGVLSGFWSAIEEQVRLASLAGHDYVAAQEDRVAVMALSHRALELATRFRESVEKEFARWQDPEDSPQRDRSLTLMSEAELEVHLAGQQIVELLDHQFLHPLSQLDERLRQLSEALGIARRRPNPLRPEVAVTAFVELFEPDDLTPGLRAMVFQQFDKRLPKVLSELYDRANATLDAAAFRAPAPGPAPRAAAPAAVRRHPPTPPRGPAKVVPPLLPDGLAARPRVGRTRRPGAGCAVSANANDHDTRSRLVRLDIDVIRWRLSHATRGEPSELEADHTPRGP